MSLRLEVVTPTGLLMSESDLDEVVVRRREPGVVLGSEVAIFPRHAPLLMQTQASQVRLTRGDLTREVALPAGVLEVWRDLITLVVTQE